MPCLMLTPFGEEVLATYDATNRELTVEVTGRPKITLASWPLDLTPAPRVGVHLLASPSGIWTLVYADGGTPTILRSSDGGKTWA